MIHLKQTGETFSNIYDAREAVLRLARGGEEKKRLKAELVLDSGEAVGKRVESLLDEFGLRASKDNDARLEFITYASEEYRLRLIAKALKR